MSLIAALVAPVLLKPDEKCGIVTRRKHFLPIHKKGKNMSRIGREGNWERNASEETQDKRLGDA